MSKILKLRSFCIRCLNAGVVALLLAILVPLSANATSHVSKPAQPTCMQAPANLDPTKLSVTQMESYGLPLRPPSSAGAQAQAKWLQLANRIKHDRHDCNTQRVTDPHKIHHHATRPPKGQLTQHTSTPNTNTGGNGWAGFVNTASSGHFNYSNATWNLPCANTNVRNTGVSFWVGIGGFGSGNGNIAQAGTDAFVEEHGYLYFNYWYEVIDGTIDHINYYGLGAPCGAQMYVEADSGSNVYFLIDGGGVNQSYTPGWPTADGSSAECFVEDPAPVQGGPREPLVNFNHMTFYNCETNLQAIGSQPYTTDVMTDDNNPPQVKANPGGFFNSGNDFNVYWRQSN